MSYKIVGLGNGGCSIATEFASLPRYDTIFRIDTEAQEGKVEKCIDIHLPQQPKSEDYENRPPDLKKYFKNLSGDVLFVVCGGGAVSLASLVILEQLKEKCSITGLYIRPDIEFMGAEAKKREKLTFGVFQEYARSGLFQRLYLVSNIMVDKAMGGVSIISYYEKLNQTIVSAFDMMENLKALKPITSTFSQLAEGTRISTFGLTDFETSIDKMFYKFDGITDIVYYLGYNEKVLKEDKTLLSMIRNMIRNKIENEKARVSYGVYATIYTSTIVLCSAHTSNPQG